jgi:hypothetical protein
MLDIKPVSNLKASQFSFAAISTNRYMNAKIVQAFCHLIFLSALLNVFAQSGIIHKTPQAISLPTPQKILSKRSNVICKTDSTNVEGYKLIFPRIYKGTRLTIGEELAKHGRHSRLDNFIEQLNEAGKQSYKLISTVSGWNPIGIVKLSEGQYEYTWFETTSPYFFAKVGFEEKYEPLAKQGFHIIAHFIVSASCEPMFPDNPDSVLEQCEYEDLFLLEKEKGTQRPVQYVLANTIPRWTAKMGIMLTTQIKERLNEGFYPKSIFSKFEILLEQAENREELLADKPDIQVINSSMWGTGNLEKKINELGKQGYKLAMINNDLAVMYKHSETISPVHYTWLDAKKKNFDKELAKLQQQGGMYRMTYPNKESVENKLIFEQSLNNNSKRFEYKVLKFEFIDTENTAEKRVLTDLSPSSKETINIFHKLIKDGFKVCDLFMSDQVSVLLERSL